MFNLLAWIEIIVVVCNKDIYFKYFTIISIVTQNKMYKNELWKTERFDKINVLSIRHVKYSLKCYYQSVKEKDNEKVPKM